MSRNRNNLFGGLGLGYVGVRVRVISSRLFFGITTPTAPLHVVKDSRKSTHVLDSNCRIHHVTVSIATT